MDNLIENLGWQKIGIVMGILGAVMLVFVFFTLLGLGKTSTSQNQAPKTSPTPAGDSRETFKANPNLPGGKKVLSEKFTNDSMQINYPSGFTPSESAINSGGDAVILTNDASRETIEIDIYNSSSMPVTQIVNALRALGYKETRTDNGQGITYKFAGSVGVGPNAIREKAIVFSQNNKTYRILLTYRSATTDSDIEQAFDDMTSSLQLF
ncbi:MAG TPA: hypothetical protein VG917_05020 [Patescibacteria group bacterium]|nr:hypothetical protein [Patescibacteria group bacterium]